MSEIGFLRLCKKYKNNKILTDNGNKVIRFSGNIALCIKLARKGLKWIFLRYLFYLRDCRVMESRCFGQLWSAVAGSMPSPNSPQERGNSAPPISVIFHPNIFFPVATLTSRWLIRQRAEPCERYLSTPGLIYRDPKANACLRSAQGCISAR